MILTNCNRTLWSLALLSMALGSSTGCRSTSRWNPTTWFAGREPDASMIAGRSGIPGLPTSPALNHSPTALANNYGATGGGPANASGTQSLAATTATPTGPGMSGPGMSGPGSASPASGGLAARSNGFLQGGYQPAGSQQANAQQANAQQPSAQQANAQQPSAQQGIAKQGGALQGGYQTGPYGLSQSMAGSQTASTPGAIPAIPASNNAQVAGSASISNNNRAFPNPYGGSFSPNSGGYGGMASSVASAAAPGAPTVPQTSRAASPLAPASGVPDYPALPALPVSANMSTMPGVTTTAQQSTPLASTFPAVPELNSASLPVPVPHVGDAGATGSMGPAGGYPMSPSATPATPTVPASTAYQPAASGVTTSGGFAPGTTGRSTNYNFGAGGSDSFPTVPNTGFPANTATGGSSLVR